MPLFRFAAQMYTLRNIVGQDFTGACRRLAALGFQGAELTDMRGHLSAADLKKLGQDRGMTWLSVHVPLEEMESELPAIMDYYREAGIATLVCPWLHEQRRKTFDDWHHIGKILGDISTTLRGAGMTLAYHHHDFEFLNVVIPNSNANAEAGNLIEQPGGAATCGMDIILRITAPADVKIELDTYWLYDVGLSPAEIIRGLAGRLALLHCKDMAMGEGRRFSPVGSGGLNWPEILSGARSAGLEWLIVEQDECYGQDPFGCLAESMGYLRRLNNMV